MTGVRLIFAGPSLSRAAIPGQATLLPPAAEGDLYRAVARFRPVAVAIVDGRFEDCAAIRHKEILWAMDRGVAMLGAASMGALRAAELAPFGMRGVGRVFEACRDGDIDADDAVAVAHAPAYCAYAPLTVALADLRFLLSAAVADGAIAAEGGEALCAAGAAIFYKDRTPAALDAVAGRLLPPAQAQALRAWRAAHGFSQKRRDALACVTALCACAASTPPLRPSLVATTHQRRAEARALAGSG